MKRMVFLGEEFANPPPCRADSMALLAPHGKKPVFADAERPHLSLAHLTSVSLSRRNFSGALSAHRAFVKQTLSNHGVRWIRTEKDLISLPADNLGVLFGMQHAPEGVAEENMRKLHDEGLQFMGLYTDSNEYGSGFNGYGGLTELGKKLLEWMSASDIILDLSHVGHQTARCALEFLRQEKLPMHPVASHSGCYSVFPHPRNLPDDVLKEIVNQEGYVGIPAIPSLLARESDDPYPALVRHVAHASSVCGANNVGIGSGVVHADVDFFWNLEKSLADKFSTSALIGFLGCNFECYLFRSLP